jgi:hypothetical protein
MMLTALADPGIQNLDQDLIVSRESDGVVVIKFYRPALLPDYCSCLRCWNILFRHCDYLEPAR